MFIALRGRINLEIAFWRNKAKSVKFRSRDRNFGMDYKWFNRTYSNWFDWKSWRNSKSWSSKNLWPNFTFMIQSQNWQVQSQRFQKVHRFIIGDLLSRRKLSSIRFAFSPDFSTTFIAKILPKTQIGESSSRVRFNESILAPLLRHRNILPIFEPRWGRFFYFSIFTLLPRWRSF